MPHPSRTLAAASATALLAVAILGALSSPVAAAGHAVSIGDGAFAPRRITIKLGDSVTWTNKGSAIHNVYFDAFHSDDTMNSGDRYTHKFTKAGSFTYVCTIHGFQGTVVVKGATSTPKPTPALTEKPTPKPTPKPTEEPTSAPTSAPTATTAPSATPAAASPSPSPEAVASIPAASPSTAGGGPVTPDSGGASSTGPLLALLFLLVVAGLVGLGWNRNRRRR
jgi:plastocyanin